MLSYTMDVEKRSTWLRTTPSHLELEQPFYCTEAGAFYARDRFQTQRSDKDSFLLFYTLGGAGEIIQGSNHVLLEKGQMLLMDCRTPQRYSTSPTRHHWYHLWVHMNGTGVASLGKLIGLPNLLPQTVTLADVRQYFDTIFENLADEGHRQSLQVGLAAHQLLVAMALAVEHGQTSEVRDAIQIARAYIESHYGENIRVESVAAEVSLSTSQLIRLFRQHLSTTPHNYLMRYRITKAKELLAETTLGVGEISRRVGFSSESNFSYRFSRMVGQSPSAYRSSAPKLFDDVETR